MHGKYGGKPLTGWRYAGFIGSFVGAVGLVMYAVAGYPYLHIEEYRKWFWFRTQTHHKYYNYKYVD